MNPHHNPVNPLVASINHSLAQIKSPKVQSQMASAFYNMLAMALPEEEIEPLKTPPLPQDTPEQPEGRSDDMDAEELRDEIILTDVDQAILDLLYRMDAPMVGPDIADAISNSLAYVKERLAKASPLRAEGLIKNKPRVGYFITDAGRSFCS